MKCVYCGCDGKMTKEHVIPKGFIKHMDWDKQIVVLEKAPSRVINSELMVKDVCSNCNNGELSKLDAYALNLFLQCNNLISINTHKFYFKFQYDNLVRWLLKICFNSARANSSDYDASLYEKNADYILNKSNIKSHVCVYAVLLGYENIGSSFIKKCHHLQKKRVYEFDWFRIAPFKNMKTMTHSSALRVVIINSFVFVIVVTDSDEEYDMVRHSISQCQYKFYELQRNGKVWLKKDPNFMMESFLSNMLLKESFMQKREKADESLRILTITREEIEEEDFSSISWLVDTFTTNRDVLRDAYQKVVIVVEGYDDEKREIYQIPEYQKYFSTVFSNYPQIIWLLWLSDNEENPLIAMLWAAVNDKSIVDLNDTCVDIYPNKEKVTKLLLGFYEGINILCHKYVIDTSINNELTGKINKLFSAGFDIPL